MRFIILFLLLATTAFAANIVKVDDREILTVSDTDRLILANDLIDVDSEITRRLQYIINDKVNDCYDRMRNEWVTGGKLEANGITSIPLDRASLVTLITTQPNYKNRTQREQEAVLEGII